MPKLVFVTGVPGAGKSLYIQEHLRGVPHLDIKDIYQRLEENRQLTDWAYAQDILLEKAFSLMKTKNTNIACEAILLPGSPSRERLIIQLDSREIAYEFIDLEVDYPTAVNRVVDDYVRSRKDLTSSLQLGKVLGYFMKRIEILNSYHQRGLI